MNTQRLTLVTVVVVALVIVGFLVYPRLAPSPAPESVALDLDGQPGYGADDAPVAIALFEDFRCPHCADFNESVLPRVESAFVDTGQARIVFLNFPVLGPASNTAALAGECVYRQSESGFWDLEEALFRVQDELADESRLRELVGTYASGIDQAAFARCMDDEEADDEVQRDLAMARSLELGGTPSVVIDGRVVQPSFDAIEQAVEQALAATP